jgi:hypothetical protein
LLPLAYVSYFQVPLCSFYSITCLSFLIKLERKKTEKDKKEKRVKRKKKNQKGENTQNKHEPQNKK